ncbi:MAG: class I SAM-dependent methyltransferase [Haliscomenobacter sp.]|uniref:class I SAM-dependent methyltransferase n=1 Tax=Haliscomenobacter sp. TaxID=2717303 RepID=UPI0029A2A17F|nr:class I SAM-dependent methyltransferase [Haliscomenobacter sp.]MDX2069001.1 class I SAM-dependent methyltransferase [Haliscomenobacter sp.]
MYEEKNPRYYALSRPEMQDYVPKSCQRILEFGCSNGDFGAQIKSRLGCIYEGIEPFESSAAVAKTKLDNVMLMSAEDYLIQPNFGQTKYDGIVFNDVLEHLVDPYTLLNKLKDALTPEGVIIASIPNILNFPAIRKLLFTKDFAYQESGIFDKTHLRFFTKKSIIRMFNEAGYSIQTIEGINRNSRGLLFRSLNLLTFKYIDEFKYTQFAVVAKKS